MTENVCHVENSKKDEREWVLFSWNESLLEHTNSTTQTLLSRQKSQTFKDPKAIPLTVTGALWWTISKYKLYTVSRY